MEAKIACDTFARLATIAITPLAKERETDCIHIETSNGVTVAIAANGKIAAIERIEGDGSDGSFTLNINQQLLDQAKTEIAFSSSIEIVANPMLNFITAKTTMGFTALGVIGHFKSSPHLSKWREWLPPTDVKKPRGGMFLGSEHIATLMQCAPSRQIVFPEIIDANNPVIVRDFYNENWFGLFLPVALEADGKRKVCDGATIPSWVK